MLRLVSALGAAGIPVMLWLFAGPVAAEIYPLDDARPRLSGSGSAIRWPSGGASFLLASAPVLRVNLRGVYVKAGQLRDLAGWSRVACNQSAFAMCHTEFGEIFASGAPNVTDSPSTLPQVSRV